MFTISDGSILGVLFTDNSGLFTALFVFVSLISVIEIKGFST